MRELFWIDSEVSRSEQNPDRKRTSTKHQALRNSYATRGSGRHNTDVGMARNLGTAGEPYSGHWSVVAASDGIAMDCKIIDRKIRAAGWTLFFLASEVKVMFFGVLGTKKIRQAVDRILCRVDDQHFNGLQVTGIFARRFLGLPYTVVTAHSRHVQSGCYLDGIATRRLSEADSARDRV